MPSPKTKRRLAFWLFWSTVGFTPPAMWVTYYWPKVGLVILQFVSFGALVLTLWDIYQTADVRVQQEDKE